MKIEILTIHRLNNFGSAFQAMALGEYLNNMVHNAEILDYHPDYYKGNKLKNKIGRILFRKMYLNRERKFSEFVRKYIPVSAKSFKTYEEVVKGPVSYTHLDVYKRQSLDEFPQFWNVLKGDMSLVGTRPPTVDEWKQYEPYHRGRLAVKPGLTGMWQVSGRSDITDFEEVVKLDMEYVKNWDIGMDIKILFKTVGVVLKGSGSK